MPSRPHSPWLCSAWPLHGPWVLVVDSPWKAQSIEGTPACTKAGAPGTGGGGSLSCPCPSAVSRPHSPTSTDMSTDVWLHPPSHPSDLLVTQLVPKPDSCHLFSQGTPGTRSTHRHVPSHGRGTCTHAHSHSPRDPPTPPPPQLPTGREDHTRPSTRPRPRPPQPAGSDRHLALQSPRQGVCLESGLLGQGGPQTDVQMHTPLPARLGLDGRAWLGPAPPCTPGGVAGS